MSTIPELPTAYEPVRLATADDARSEAARRARDGAPEGTLVWVETPTHPRARAGRDWLLPPGGGLHAALLLRPGLPAATCAELAVAVVLALGRAIADVVAPVTQLHYRWPNDVLLNNGKAAGVWLEGSGTGEALDWLVLGWAVNTAESPADLGFEAAGVAPEGHVEAPGTGPLLQAIARHLLAWIERWDEEGFAPLRASWCGRLTLDEPIRLRLPDGAIVEGTAEAVDDAGALSVRTDAGTRQVTLAEFFELPGQPS